MKKLLARTDKLHGKLLNRWRVARLNLRGASVDPSVKVFGSFTVIGSPENLHIGQGTSINQGVFLNARDRLEIGAGVHLSPGCQIHTGSLTLPAANRRHVEKPVRIGDNVWLASGVVVGPGVTIGDNSIIGANSFVNRDVPANVFYAGVPARQVGVVPPA